MFNRASAFVCSCSKSKYVLNATFPRIVLLSSFPSFFFFLFYRLLRVRLPIAEMESEFSSRSTSPSSLNLSACPNHASIDHVAPLTRPKGNVISREGEGRFPKGRFSPFIPSTRILISSMMFGEVIFRQICVR